MLAKEHREMMAGRTAQIPPCPAPPITEGSVGVGVAVGVGVGVGLGVGLGLGLGL